MSNKLETMKVQVAIKKVEAAKAELEMKILERLEDIERMKEHIDIQDEKLKELKQELGE